MSALPRALWKSSVAAGALAATSVAAQDTTTGVNVSAAAGVTSNPYLTEENSREAGVLDVEVRPWMRIETARTTFDLAAYANGRVFSNTYDFEDSEGASVAFRSKRSSRTSLYGSAALDSTSARSIFPRSGASPGVTDPVNPVDPGTLQTEAATFLPGDDITLLGLTGRTTSISTDLGVDHQLSARSYLGASAGYQHLSASGSAVIGYDSFTAGAAYSRQVSEQTRAGARLQARRTAYDAGGHSTILVVEGTLEQRLDAYWTLTAAAGVSTARTSAVGAFPASRSTGVGGMVALCNERPSRNFCASLERSQLPGAVGRTQRVDNAVLSYGERLSARERVEIGARYARSRTLSRGPFAQPSVKIASVEANYTRTLGERTEAYAFASVARSYSDLLTSGASVNAGVGIRLRLGRTK
ncbi:hypothetical protein ACWPM1_13700 [Tsuneonella sp. HG249]